MRVCRIALTLLVAVAALVTAPAALADDESVFNAWTAENVELAQLEKQLGKDLRTWENSSFMKGAPAISTIRKIRKVVARRRKAVTAQEPSTTDGKHGRNLALANLRDYDAAMVRLRRAIEAGMDREFKKSNGYIGEYRTLIKRAGKYEDRANDAFREAGVL